MLDLNKVDFLSDEEIKEQAPSVFTSKPSGNVSKHYTHIPTTKVINDMRTLGWDVVDVKEVAARTSATVGVQKHLVVFRNPDVVINGNDNDTVFPQILLTNSHDGKNSFTFAAGLYRMICENGLVVSDTQFEDVKMRHMGYSFEELQNKNSVQSYFTELFPDFVPLIPNLYDQWRTNPTSSLAIIKTYPWNVKEKALLVGDSAHATVPFYGQGMNAGFEDCRILDELLDSFNENWKDSFNEYSRIRKPNGDGIQDLSMQNFIVMRDKTADSKFLLQKVIEKKFANLYPEKWTPLYSMVSFTNIPYSVAWEIGIKQENLMKEIMNITNIEKIWDRKEIMQKMYNLV